ncbi:MAG: hypothetical protein HY286_14540 [Planctomycetes bacterium]|nr:hypothetical protein [Planctomycetota bacterium]
MPVCPHCGAAVRRGAASCRACGSDAATGWSDSDTLDSESTEVPEFDDDDYNDFLAREGLGGRPRKRAGMPRWFIVIVVALVLAGFVMIILKH